MKHIITSIALILSPLLPCAEAAEKPAPALSDTQRESAKRDNKRAAREAMQRDSRLYDTKQYQEIETDYQAAAARYREADVRTVLEAFLKKWTKGNRVGCATLYLAQKSRGEEREKLLRLCIADFSDCYYLNGCQVGALARLHLWSSLKTGGKTAEADTLLAELKAKFSLANDHTGKVFSDILEGGVTAP